VSKSLGEMGVAHIMLGSPVSWGEGLIWWYREINCLSLQLLYTITPFHIYGVEHSIRKQPRVCNPNSQHHSPPYDASLCTKYTAVTNHHRYFEDVSIIRLQRVNEKYQHKTRTRAQVANTRFIRYPHNSASFARQRSSPPLRFLFPSSRSKAHLSL
jgi:hypothetical protein